MAKRVLARYFSHKQGRRQLGPQVFEAYVKFPGFGCEAFYPKAYSKP